MIAFASIAFFFKRVFYFVVDNWKIVLPIAAIAVLVFMFARYCGPKPPKLDEAQIQRGEEAKKQANDKELREILVESDVAVKEINANTAYAETEKLKAIDESRKKWANANRDDLQAEFDRRKGQ